MEEEILNIYDIKFGFSPTWKKFIVSQNAISFFLNCWTQKDEIDNILEEVNLAIEGRYEQIRDTYYFTNIPDFYGYLEPDRIIINGSIPDPFTVPVMDFKKLLEIWRDYLYN
ncbi:MAG: hypothetical protein ACO1OF_13275 [Adhaeribacter sp.]